jgi:hypothetical protein
MRLPQLPKIPVKQTLVRKVLNLTPPLENKLHAYIAYYAEQQGLQADQAPTDSDTIIALLENFLDRDTGFNQHLRSKAMPPRRTTAAADTRKKGTASPEGNAT